MDMFMVLVLTTVFFPFSIEASKCSGSCNNINYPYGKDFEKIRFESNDDLPMNKPRRLHLLAIIIRCVFNEGSKFYPQIFLDDAS